MDFKSLENNLINVMKENQIKIGYDSIACSLNYPLVSLNNLIGEQCDAEMMKQRLLEFSGQVSDRLGLIEVSERKGIFTLKIPQKGADYVHEHTESSEFIVRFIETVREHGVTFEQVMEVFRQYSDKVHVEEVSNGEFDYLVYFEDGIPDDFIYCLTLEGPHITYHRFTKDDYKDFNF
ncbi:MAG: DUF3877 family protein [Huintestinicola sp.]